MNTRNWSIRSKIVTLVTVPIAALLALWIFATTLTVGPAFSLLNAQTLLDEVGRPAEALVAELQHERRLSLIYLGGEREVPALGVQRTRTDEAIATLRRRAGGGELRDAASGLLLERLDQMFSALDILSSGRGFIDRREMDKSGALGLYTGVVDSAFRVFATMATLPDEELSLQVRTLTALGRAREVLGQSDALLAGVFSAGRFAEGEHGQLVQIIGSQRFLYVEAVADLSGPDRTAYQRLTEDEAFVRLRELEERVVAQGRTGARPPVDAAAWQSAYDSVQQQLREFELTTSDALAARTKPVALGILLRLGLAGVLGLVAVILSVVISLRIGRSLIRRLTGLRATALELADERLPAVVGRLRRGEDVDVAAESPPLEYGVDEIGQVGHAFSQLQRSAVGSAVEEAALRRGLNEVFLNIARRSQTLLHRQLALLDRMERRTTEPEELEDLFRIDHLATRMRRHAEDLVILAGAAPGRGWRNPVPMIDVIRGAVSEVADYARVDILLVESSAVVGRAVGDLIHLLAELIENATSFSPPHTRVHVAGQLLPNGYAIEIEDRGLGMTPEAIEDANRRLADPPDFDPANSARLGLFVVARLGARLGVKVQLRSSPYGGVRAVALVPTDLVVPAPGTLALPDRPASLADVPARPGAAALDASPVRAETDRPETDRPETDRPETDRPETDRAETDRDGGQTMELPRVPRLAVVRPEHPPAEPERRVTPARPGAVPTQRPASPSATPTLRPDQVPTLDAQPAVDAAPLAGGNGSSSGPHQPASPPGELEHPRRHAASRENPIGEDGLPLRIRQTSLAPQLRQPASSAADRRSATEPAPRSPEQVRARMSALQAGTVRGRQDAASTVAGGTTSVPTVRPDADGESADPERDA